MHSHYFFLLISDTLSMDCDNEAIMDLMLPINLFSGFFLSVRMMFLSIFDTLLIDCDSEAVTDLMLSINLFSGSFFYQSQINYQQDLTKNPA